MLGFRRVLSFTLWATLLSACELPPILDPQIAELCRAHSNNVLIFNWQHERRGLPVEPAMTREEDAEWRALLSLPPYNRVPDRTLDRLSRPISAVQRFGEAWLVGTDHGEWFGDLFFVQQGRSPQRLVHGNVHALVPTSAGVYALFGLAHLGSDEGYYRLVTSSNEGVVIGEEQPLPGSPRAIARDGGATFAAGGGLAGSRTWARVFGQGEPMSAAVSSACR